MAITSAEIHEQGFSVTRKAGYDIDEVDVFLEYVASGIDALNAEIEELLAQIDELQAQASLAPAAAYEPAAAPAPLTPAHGDFEASEFVRSTVGADNVCERSAVRSAGESATVLVHKRRMDGVTVAIAQEDWSVSFE